MEWPIFKSTIDYLDFCNIQYNKLCNGNQVTWRWPLVEDEIIPVVIGAVPAEYARERMLVDQAIAEINRRLGTELLRLASMTTDMPHGFIKISFGTAFEPDDCVDPCHCRANVSQKKGEGTQIVPGSDERFATSVVWLNIGNGKCDVELEHVVHEFGHALGLVHHFRGFGDRRVISRRFWHVLATLYGNKPGTALADLRLVPARA